MPKIILTAQVEDSAAWEGKYRTRGALLKSMTTSRSNYAATENNEIAIFTEAEDLGKFMEVLESDATAEAMAEDGVKRDTVKLYVLDKEFTF